MDEFRVEEDVEQTQSQEEETSDLENEDAVDEEHEDYQTKYKELQGKHDQLVQKSRENEQLIDTVSPYVDWDAARGNPKDEPDDEDADEYISKRDLDKTVNKLRSELANERLINKFRQDNPELRDYEDLVSQILLTKTDPRAKMDTRLAEAVGKTKEFLDAERAKGRAETAKKKKSEAADAASGLSSTAATTKAPKDEPAGETYDDYMARRKEQSRKARGLV